MKKYLVEGGVLVGIWHDDTVVLGAHVRLDALAILAGGAAVDVLSGAVATDEGDGLDVLVVTDKVDAIVGAVNNVQATSWKTGLQHELD